MNMNLKKIAAIFLIAVAGGAVALGLSRVFEKKTHLVSSIQPTIPVRQASIVAMPGDVPGFEDAAAISIHAVVHIKTEFQKKSMVYDDYFNFFNFGQPNLREQNVPIEGMGSGVIISPDGFIVTNNHVVQEANTITVTLNDKRVYKATIVGTDPSTDLALIKIDEKGLPFLTYGNSDDVKIGQWVLAVGNPFNLTSTVTAGIVSAKARNINILGEQGAIESFIQTDAAVNPGNSGGALVNTSGQLIGINAAIASGTGYYTGYSFAIPVNIVRKVVTDFMNTGRLQRAYLGVYYREIDDEVARNMGLNEIRGIYVDKIVPGGAAEKAGIRQGDVITSLGTMPVNSKSELQEVIGQHNPSDIVAVTIYRDGKEITMNATLLGEESQAELVADNGVVIRGATFEQATPGELQRFGLRNGYKITRLEPGKLKSAGINEGFIVVAIDHQPIQSIEDLKKAFGTKNGGVLIEGMYPNGMKVFYGIGL
jgi:serine protease Do